MIPRRCALKRRFRRKGAYRSSPEVRLRASFAMKANPRGLACQCALCRQRDLRAHFRRGAFGTRRVCSRAVSSEADGSALLFEPATEFFSAS
jgi:hypothetical protein